MTIYLGGGGGIVLKYMVAFHLDLSNALPGAYVL